MIDERMKLFDCVKKGWVIDGFPQTREQALALQSRGIYPKHVGKIEVQVLSMQNCNILNRPTSNHTIFAVRLDAEDTVLIERAAGKRVDPQTGGNAQFTSKFEFTKI